MYRGLRTIVVVPAFNEEALIQATLKSIPDWVDGIVVVDDASTDSTSAQVEALSDPRVSLLTRGQNAGVGRAILDGYAEALQRGGDALVVMAGDNQMDPTDLPALLDPIHEGADYCKGNRFAHPRYRDMPPHRRLGSAILAQLTRWTSKLPVTDSQCGYTALARQAAPQLLAAKIWEGYGYPNDVLLVLGKQGARVAEVPVRPVYASEVSGLRLWHFFSILRVIARRTLQLRRQAPPQGVALESVQLKARTAAALSDGVSRS